MSNVDDLLDRCRQASSEAIEKSNSLTEFNARSRKQLLAASNEFFVELLDLAQAIAGEYDKTALTPAVRNHTLTQLNELIAVGEKIKAIAEDAENHVDTTDQQIANIVDEQLIPTLNEAKQRQASLQAQLSSVQNEVSTLQEHDENAATGAQIGTVFAWVFCPPVGAALQFTVVKQARDRVDGARNDLNNAVQSQLARANDFNNARGRQTEAEIRVNEINNALVTMPSLLSVAEATRKQCEDLRNPIIALKNQQDLLADVLSHMQNAASTARLDTRKRALGSDILRVISLGLIDMTLIGPAKAVKDELVQHDDEMKSITGGLAEQLKALEATEAAINVAQVHLTSA
ncbi:hypothetical protein BKA64DRAFT_771632 [Cadophora sp. MPI-SDFR-AT-0126]|nr:hypothetical protein BKA64DRAFT_771632 [Leotiomycetes sp. MPI-SDFR-AT-0126]